MSLGEPKSQLTSITHHVTGVDRKVCNDLLHLRQIHLDGKTARIEIGDDSDVLRQRVLQQFQGFLQERY